LGERAFAQRTEEHRDTKPANQPQSHEISFTEQLDFNRSGSRAAPQGAGARFPFGRT